MTIVLGVLCGALLGVVVLFARDRARLLERLSDADTHIAQLESDLDAALRPPPPANTAERAVRRVIRTASKVRSHGITGLIQSTVGELQTWASDAERADILNMAASDGTVTLFFSDIEDSTPLNDRLGDTTWVKVLAAHDRVLRNRIERYRGQVVKTAGDGFMVAFRDTEAACRAALGIQRDLPRDLTLRRHGPILVRIGIHTGQVVARDGDYFGRNVAMAARVADLAHGGEILASDAVREALDDDTALTLVERDTVELKGLTGEHVVWQILPPAS
ncbi:adenylate/guanylate cyclase domain-containing protein [Nocardioides daeguensis]|uniref:Guanylate cyclase domain-containing protein n=1 Tax=Nocardioides daeguensis TaxID=908359 RepID=A0ABP6VDJ5_9ACTN|nr:adenylate/guanylate cyclase domain-containing protein [Nocardioides daeguensis]MBV6729505.1 adenylate/guanylate cyclase domain-containing protein [Nocardioides daeguensis]MCR1771722.1 adenylate/guanylate cyclase domain-containing protein [Nocardioides daeguensis]